MTFFGVFLTFSLFLISIVPVFVGLAEDSKAYITRTVSFIEHEAKSGFPMIDGLPLQLGKTIRSQVDVTKIADFVTDPNRTEFVLNGLLGNIDTIRDFLQK